MLEPLAATIHGFSPNNSPTFSIANRERSEIDIRKSVGARQPHRADKSVGTPLSASGAKNSLQVVNGIPAHLFITERHRLITELGAVIDGGA